MSSVCLNPPLFYFSLIKVRFDNTSEFFCGKFRDYCNLESISLQPAEAYEHEHNGSSEHWNRSLQEKIRAVQYDSKFKLRYWN